MTAGSHDAVLDAVRVGIRVYDLSRPLRVGMPQSPNHPPFWHSLPRRHGDTVRADGGSAASDHISLGTHVGTHVDAVAHVSHEGRLHGGLDAAAEQAGGRFERLGIDAMEPYVGRAVLLDVPAQLGWDICPPGYEITANDLEDAAEAQGTRPEDGDVVFIRSGWGRHWDDAAAYVGNASGVPGVGEPGAKWLAGRGLRAVGADTTAFEHLAPGAGHALLPAHRVLLVEHGINIVETLVLDELAADGVHVFTLVLNPLPIVGATGAPVRPLAVVAS